MDTRERHALAVIRRCVRKDRYLVLPHFTRQMDARGLFWPDVQCVLDQPGIVRDDGDDDQGRPKWVISGKTTDRMDLALVCVLDVDSRGDFTVFITSYWDEE